MNSQRVSGKQQPHLNQSVSSTDMCVCYMCFFLIVSQHLCSKAQLYKPVLPHKPVRRHCIDRFCVITEEQASSCLDALRLCLYWLSNIHMEMQHRLRAEAEDVRWSTRFYKVPYTMIVVVMAAD